MNGLELDRMRKACKAAVEEWIIAKKQEEALASVNHFAAEIGRWKQAHFKCDAIRGTVRRRKSNTKTRCAKSSITFEQDTRRKLASVVASHCSVARSMPSGSVWIAS
jgi:hypothetical protein